MTRSHLIALTSRPDLLAEEACEVWRDGTSWADRRSRLGYAATTVEAALSRRLIVEAMAELEAEATDAA